VELGKLHWKPNSASRDLAEAGRWFRKAAEAGNSTGMVLLGDMYSAGEGLPRNYTEAARWFQQAAEAGDRNGMENLAHMYYNGHGVPKDASRAVTWYSKASSAGNANATYRLATLYENGLGVEKNRGQAIALYRTAAARGSEDARKRLEKISADGTSAGQPGHDAMPPSTAGDSVGTRQLTVPGNQPWVDSGIRVSAGETITVKALGRISVTGGGRQSFQSPAGTGSDCRYDGLHHRRIQGFLAPDLPCWSLVGRIGTAKRIFAIGVERNFQAIAPGELYFGVNDGVFGGNTGGWIVSVRVQPVPIK